MEFPDARDRRIADEEQGWEDQAREEIVIEGIRRQCKLVPGLALRTGVTCRWPEQRSYDDPSVPNHAVVTCHYLVNHEGKHSWASAWDREE